ncbi:MAG: PTS sugar transporter subunit IIA [Gemmataceae bacterium]
MDVEQLAGYLSRDAREIGKLASRGALPGRKVNGEWRFARAEIHHWLETRLHEWTSEELLGLEGAHPGEVEEPLMANLLRPESVAVPLAASTRPSVLRELLKLAEAAYVLYDADAVYAALIQREEMGSTALPGGVAIPHPHRPQGPGVLGESVVALGVTGRGIAFGGPRGELSDVFFLVACTDDRTHLRVLARISRLMRVEGLIDRLRGAETADEARDTILSAERALLG